MAFDDYRQGLRTIAECQADGQETDDMVAGLAEAVDLDPSMIQAEVDEILAG